MEYGMYSSKKSKVYNLTMARKDERIELPDEVLEKEVLSWDEWVQVYLGAYKYLTGEDYPYPVTNMEEWKKLQRTVWEIETDLKNRGEWPPKHHANKRKRKNKKSK